MPVIGTAGHVDHGKSTLILALTGRDPDRLAEEKRRGLTIDLGFAWMDLDGVPVGFVDVPGHERFIKNMLAGIDAVQVVLFAVAADEGWMPQSEEHLAALDLLGHRRAVIAMTRRDLVDDDTAELVRLEIEDAIAGTSLEGSAIVEVAAPTGLGLDQLRTELGHMIGGPDPAPGRARMWVDRSFTIAGSGTVITGTLIGDEIRIGDELQLFPGKTIARVRGLQSHETTSDVAVAGSRTALNLGGVETSAIARGSMVGRPGQWRTTTRLLATMRAARGMEDALADRGAYHLHAGSGAWPIRLRMMSDSAAIITVAEPIPLAMTDRFILRDVGRRAIVGGGVVLDPAPPKRRPSADSVDALVASLAESAPARANLLVELRTQASIAEVRADTGAEPQGAITVGDTAFSKGAVDRIRRAAADLVADYHSANPLRPGIPSASLAEQLSITVEQLSAISSDDLVIEAGYVRAGGFAGELDPRQQGAVDELRTKLLEAGLAVPRASQLGIDLELRHALERRGQVVRIDDDLIYLPEQIETIKSLVIGFDGDFSVADFRDAAGISRRQAVPLLEWLDRQGVTVRDGDLRRAITP